MTTVIVTIVFKGNRLQKVVGESNLKKRSILLRDALNNTPASADGSPKRIDVHGSHPPMAAILDQIQTHAHSQNFKLRFASLPIERVAILWEASQMLQVVPEQVHLRTHIRGVVTHNKLRPDQLITLHRVLQDTKDVVLKDERLSTWAAMVHQTAWMIEKEEYTEDEITALQQAAESQQPELADAIVARLLDLQQRRHNFSEARANAQQQQATKTVDRRVPKHKTKQRKQQQGAEVLGEWNLTEEMARHVFTRPPPSWVTTVREGKHGKRNPRGHGRRGRKGGAADEEGVEEE